MGKLILYEWPFGKKIIENFLPPNITENLEEQKSNILNVTITLKCIIKFNIINFNQIFDSGRMFWISN